MASDHDAAIRQLIDQHADGRVPDDRFEQEIRTLVTAAGPGYLYGGESFDSERAMLVRFLDDFRAAEQFGSEVLALWVGVTKDPALRGGLHVISAREGAHAALLARRLEALGAACTADLSPQLKSAARERLASAEVPDIDKLRDFVVRYPDIETGLKPIRDIIAQIDDDLETRALLGAILDDEQATLRWMLGTFRQLSGAGDSESSPGS